MHFINPFKGLRPTKENASSVTIASTDHLSEEMQKDHLKKIVGFVNLIKRNIVTKELYNEIKLKNGFIRFY